MHCNVVIWVKKIFKIACPLSDLKVVRSAVLCHCNHKHIHQIAFLHILLK